ncbi:MAG: SUMF1/EgtB/PvdO family nonheme iron enzyme, partial [Isosphaeraceae bacterium]|nr:SUMF1/EgtB/PvdO family nonheme iron enzyme [Isosphaeraceae bacterium]
PGPDGLSFVRVPASEEGAGYFIATTETTNEQVSKHLKDYDPKAGRSDEFALEDPTQPALNLTPQRANEYLAALGQSDPSGVSYRLPTKTEWLRAARAGRTTAFWWGDEPTHPEGANFLGPEPALEADTTAPSRPARRSPGFQPNPWGLYHTFGNIAEWASDPAGGFVRLGGHFRTEPASPLPEIAVEEADALGPDPYVGLRPAFDLSAEQGANLVRRALRTDPGLAGVQTRFDPDRATVTLTGTVADSRLRGRADDLLRPLWFLAAVENQLVTPTMPSGRLATLGAPVERPRRIAPLGRIFDEVPLAVHWSSPLPVLGSEWWVNVYPGAGGHFAHVLVERQPDASGRVTVLLDRSKLPVGAPASVALSLGGPAPTPQDPRIVSNILPLPKV